MNKSTFTSAHLLAISILLFLLGSTTLLVVEAIKTAHVEESRQHLQNLTPSSETILLLNSQIENAKRKLPQLDPGPPPPWYTPGYYLEWTPRARLYGEAQETLFTLQRQKRELIETAKGRAEDTRKVWNFGIAPVLHLLLALSLGIVALRVLLRMFLSQGRFGWQQLER